MTVYLDGEVYQNIDRVSLTSLTDTTALGLFLESGGFTEYYDIKDIDTLTILRN
jgi:hypothetical protein